MRIGVVKQKKIAYFFTIRKIILYLYVAIFLDLHGISIFFLKL